MWEGEILQAGDTPSVYRKPQSLRVAEVFSDPPLNKIGVEKKDGSIHYASGERAPANGLYRDLADGGYKVGFRAHQLAPASGKNERHSFATTVLLTEITGSESFVHLKCNGSNWVAVMRGVVAYAPGDRLDTEIDPANLYIFDLSGRLVAAPATM